MSLKFHIKIDYPRIGCLLSVRLMPKSVACICLNTMLSVSAYDLGLLFYLATSHSEKYTFLLIAMGNKP